MFKQYFPYYPIQAESNRCRSLRQLLSTNNGKGLSLFNPGNSAHSTTAAAVGRAVNFASKMSKFCGQRSFGSDYLLPKLGCPKNKSLTIKCFYSLIFTKHRIFLSLAQTSLGAPTLGGKSFLLYRT